jgi:hypothetical protein
MNNKLLIGMLIFLIGVLLFEANGFLIHHDLYQYGLQYSDTWADADKIIKFLMYQFLILMPWLYHRSWKLIIFQEALWYSCFQDIIVYAVWCGMQFPNPQNHPASGY